MGVCVHVCVHAGVCACVWQLQQGSQPCTVGLCSPGVKHCVAGITSSSSLSEELLGVLSEAWAFLGVLVAWVWAGVAAGPAGLRLGSTKIRGVLITLKNKNKTQPPSD